MDWETKIKNWKAPFFLIYFFATIINHKDNKWEDFL